MSAFRPMRQQTMPRCLFKPAAAGQFFANRRCLLPHRSSPHNRRDHGRRNCIEADIEGAVEGAAVVAPRARRCHPPVDAEDVVDDMARVVVLAAIGIGSRHLHLHLLRLLLLHPGRPSPSLLTGSSSASPSTMAPARTPLGCPASLARWST
jgi:hypothetical protein